MDPYKVLQVDPEAEDEVIQAAYRRLAQKYHPDIAGPDAATRMTAINAAWELLRDPISRAAHDRSRHGRAADPSDGSGRTAAAAPVSTTGPDHGGTTTTQRGAPARPPETVSAAWTSGRSSEGSGYDPNRMRAREGPGAAGPPPGNPSGTVLQFGRYSGWSLAEIGRVDVDYLEWLDRMPIGRPYRDEIDGLLRGAGRRRSVRPEDDTRRGLFRRR